MPSRSQKRSFACSPILNSLPRGMAVKPPAVVGRKVVLDAGQQLHRNAVQAVVGRAPACVCRCWRYTISTPFSLSRIGFDLRVRLHELTDLRHEASDDAVHAADGLHHHRRLIVGFAEAHQIHEARIAATREKSSGCFELSAVV